PASPTTSRRLVALVTSTVTLTAATLPVTTPLVQTRVPLGELGEYTQISKVTVPDALASSSTPTSVVNVVYLAVGAYFILDLALVTSTLALTALPLPVIIPLAQARVPLG